MEDVAKEYMKDLVRRNLVLFERDEDEWYKTWYSIHDVLRDLCIRKAEEENLIQIFVSKIKKGQRRLIFHHTSVPKYKVKSPLRSILDFSSYNSYLYNFVSQFKLLKMVYDLKVKQRHLTSPESIIFKLIHLRFLGMSFFGFGDDGDIHIDESIVKLQNLQTLTIKYYGPRKIVFPCNFWRMPKLRHLVRTPATSPTNVLLPDIQYVGTHYDLQTLSGVMNFKFTMDAIDSFSNLKILKIVYEEVACEDWAHYCVNNIVHLNCLEELDFETPPALQMNIVFPRNLKRLNLSDSRMSREMMSCIGSLENLEVLTLMYVRFEEEEWELIEEEFLRLRYLEMVGLNLKKWNAEDTHFPCIEKLSIVKCSFEIPDSIGDIPTLQKINISYCRKVTVESARRIQDKQLSYGNDMFHLVLFQPQGNEIKDEQLGYANRKFLIKPKEME